MNTPNQSSANNGPINLSEAVVDFFSMIEAADPGFAQRGAKFRSFFAQREAEFRSATARTPEQETELRAGYESLTAAELRRRGSGRGFRPSQLNQLRKAELVELFIDQLGWGGRLLDESREERHRAWAAARTTAALGVHENTEEHP